MNSKHFETIIYIIFLTAKIVNGFLKIINSFTEQSVFMFNFVR
jgi:hypothetical protein